jgi:hypothetical protein
MHSEAPQNPPKTHNTNHNAGSHRPSIEAFTVMVVTTVCALQDDLQQHIYACQHPKHKTAE